MKPEASKNLSNIILVAALIALVGVNVWYVMRRDGGEIGVGQVAPDFTLPLLQPQGSDQEVTLSKLAGKVVVMDFWATWCDGCKRGFPELEAFYREVDPNKVVVLAVNHEGNVSPPQAAAQVGKFVEKNGYTMPILLDNGSVFSRYGVTGIPQTFIIDAQGQIRYVLHGAVSRGDLQRNVESLLR